MPELKSSKKRSAPSNSVSAPASKKPKVVHHPAAALPTAKKGKQPVKVKGKKRAQAVTLPLKDDSDTSDEEDDEGEDEEFGGVGFDEDLDDDEDDDLDVDVHADVGEVEAAEKSNSMEVDSKPPKDPKASAEAHKAQRVLQAQRRAAKPHADVLTQAKAAWASARKKELSKSEREKAVGALRDVVVGHVQDIVFKHDASRIVQTLVKHGGQKERDGVASELKGRYIELAQSKYSKFLVTKLIRYCPTHRASILRELQGHVLRLLLHREASSVIADAFEMWANAYERSLLTRDFYGKEASLFTISSGSEQEKEAGKRGLKGLLEGADEEKRKRTLGAVKESLFSIFNNSEKGAVTHAIVHRVLWEYLSEVNPLLDAADREKLLKEMFENCQELLAEMVHTKDGSRCVREFIARGSAKDRKQIVKTLKPHIERMCKDDEAQLVLFTALDIIDDTKLTAKSIVTDINSHASTLYSSPQGRRSLLYLLVPRSRRHFTPAQIASLAETDAARAETSKKDVQVRAKEVRAAASDALIELVSSKGEELSRDPGGSLLVIEIMLHAEGDKSSAIETLLKPLSAPYPSALANHPHALDIPHTSRLYKTLLQGGHFSQQTKTIDTVPASVFSPAAFAAAWIRIVGKEVTVAAALGGGAFVVAELCERVRAEGGEEEKGALKGWFGKDAVKRIDESEVKGKEIVLKSIQGLVSR